MKRIKGEKSPSPADQIVTGEYAAAKISVAPLQRNSDLNDKYTHHSVGCAELRGGLLSVVPQARDDCLAPESLLRFARSPVAERHIVEPGIVGVLSVVAVH